MINLINVGIFLGGELFTCEKFPHRFAVYASLRSVLDECGHSVPLQKHAWKHEKQVIEATPQAFEKVYQKL